MDLSESTQAALVEHGDTLDDMYWVVFRYLTVNRRYEPVPITELFNHLARNGVLNSDDTEESVCAEVLGWAKTISQDAQERGRRGTVSYLPERAEIVFAAHDVGDLAYYAEQVQRKLGRKVAASTVKISEDGADRAATSSEMRLEEASLAEPNKPEISLEGVLAVIEERLRQSENGILRQADFKRELAQVYTLTEEAVQAHIDDLCALGVIKKLQKNNARWLKVTSKDEAAEIEARITETRRQKFEHEMNLFVMIEIVRALSAPKTHAQQRFSMIELWRMMNGATTPTAEQEAVLKRQCRLMAHKNILVMKESTQNRGSIRSKAASYKVLKVGFASQEAKDEASGAISNEEAFRTFLSGMVNK